MVASTAWAANSSAGVPRIIGRAPSEQTITLQPLLVPAAGTEAAYFITESSSQETVNVSGFFLLIGGYEDTHSEQGVRVHYTVLESDPVAETARLLVRAQPIDSQTWVPSGPVRWERTYLLSVGDVTFESGSVIPEAYEDLVEPTWLADWSATSLEDLPRTPLQPGAEWVGAADLDLDEFPADLQESTLTGRFVDWVEPTESGGRAAHINERFVTSGSSRDELFEGVHGDQAVYMEAEANHWLVQGGFPLRADKSVIVTSATYVGPETGAPEGLAGELEFNLHMMQVIEADPRVEAYWLEFVEDNTIALGQSVTGALNPSREMFEDGTYLSEFIYHGQAGETVSFRLESEEFDAFLMLLSDADELLAHDDDSSGGTNSLVTVELPYSGVYYVIASTVYPGEEGRFVLTAEAPEESI